MSSREWLISYPLMGVNFDDEVQGLRLVYILPDSWETIRVSMIVSASEGVVSQGCE